MSRIVNRIAVVGAVVAGCVALSGPAASAAELSVLGVEVHTGGALYPGATADLTVIVHNPNRHDVTVTDIVGSLVTSDNARCSSATGVSFADQRALSEPVAAGTTSTIVLAGALTMSNESAAECAGATFEIPLTVTAAGTADLSDDEVAGGWLPRTGDRIAWLAGAGGLLVAAGAALVALTRRRSRRAA